jgi:hypothetical protein
MFNIKCAGQCALAASLMAPVWVGSLPSVRSQNLPQGFDPQPTVENLKPGIRDEIRDPFGQCDIQLFWRITTPTSSFKYRSVGGSSASVTAPGKYTSSQIIRAFPVYKNVGKGNCKSFTNRIQIRRTVDGAYSGTFDRNAVTCRGSGPLNSLRPGETCNADGVKLASPAACPVGGGKFFAQAARMNWDRNQRNNTYKVIFKTRRGDRPCPQAS